MAGFIWTIFGLAVLFSTGAIAGRYTDRDVKTAVTFTEAVKIGHNQMALAIFLCLAAAFWVIWAILIVAREVFG